MTDALCSMVSVYDWDKEDDGRYAFKHGMKGGILKSRKWTWGASEMKWN